MILLDLSRCRLLVRAIACSWPVGACGVGRNTGCRDRRDGLREEEEWRDIRVCVLVCFFFFYSERRRGRWRQGVGGRGGGGAVDTWTPLRPSLPALSRRRLEREEESALKQEGWTHVSEESERKQIRKYERETGELTRKHDYSHLEQLATKKNYYFGFDGPNILTSSFDVGLIRF